MSEVSSAGKIVHVFLVLLEVSWAPRWSPMLIHAQQTPMAQLVITKTWQCATTWILDLFGSFEIARGERLKREMCVGRAVVKKLRSGRLYVYAKAETGRRVFSKWLKFMGCLGCVYVPVLSWVGELCELACGKRAELSFLVGKDIHMTLYIVHTQTFSMHDWLFNHVLCPLWKAKGAFNLFLKMVW